MQHFEKLKATIFRNLEEAPDSEGTKMDEDTTFLVARSGEAFRVLVHLALQIREKAEWEGMVPQVGEVLIGGGWNFAVRLHRGRLMLDTYHEYLEKHCEEAVRSSGIPYKAERPVGVINARNSDEDPIWIRVEPGGQGDVIARVVSEGPLKGIIALPAKPGGWKAFEGGYGRVNEYTRDGGKLVIYGASMFKSNSLFAARREV